MLVISWAFGFVNIKKLKLTDSVAEDGWTSPLTWAAIVGLRELFSNKVLM